MSFWQDLEEMQKEIENLDTQSGSRANSKGNSKRNSQRNSRAGSKSGSRDINNTNSIQRARISELEEKAKSLSRMISKQTKKTTTTTKTNIQSPTFSKNIDLCVKDAAKSHDANVQLMHHLAALEGEIQTLTKKEDVWHDTAKVIQSEVASLRAQINAMKSQQKSATNTNTNTNTRSVTYSKDNGGNSRSRNRNSRNGSRDNKYVRGRRNRDIDDDRSRIETITERTEYTEVDTRDERERPVEPARQSMNRRISEPRQSTGRTYEPSSSRIGAEPVNTRSEFQTRTVIKETRTEKDSINIYQYQRLERVNEQLASDYERLQKDYQRAVDKFTTEKQQLNAKLSEKDAKLDKYQRELQNKEYCVGEERQKCNDLQQQIIVLQQVVDDFDHLKDGNNKLQLEYQRSLQDILEARKDKSNMDMQLNTAKNQIQELEIQMRQCHHEKMGAMSEMRAMKNVFEQERKNLSDRYERTTQKLQAELSYAKKMYQEIKRKYRDLSIKFEQDQPCYAKLKEQLESERDAFQAKLNDVVIGHVSNLDMISKQSNAAIENSKWIQKVETEENNNEVLIQFGTSTTTQIKTDMNTPSQGRRMTAIWEPNQ